VSRPTGASPWAVLPQQATDVFIETALPWAERVGKVNLRTGVLSHDFVTVHFAALVVGHRFANSRRPAVEHGREALVHRTGAGMVHLVQYHEAGGGVTRPAARLVAMAYKKNLLRELRAVPSHFRGTTPFDPVQGGQHLGRYDLSDRLVDIVVSIGQENIVR